MPADLPLALADLQARFWEFACRPQTAALAVEPLVDHVRGDERLSSRERLSIYANMYYHRLLDTLQDQFPKVAVVLGEENFAELVRDYLRALPPRHPSIDWVGERFSGFIENHLFGTKQPWLHELASLELARTEVFVEADAERLVAEDLARLGDNLADLVIHLVPAHRRLHARHAVHDAWRALDQNLNIGPPAIVGTQLLVWRQDLVVYHRALDPQEAGALDRIGDGISIGALCEWLSVNRANGEAAKEAFALLGRWIADGLITRGKP